MCHANVVAATACAASTDRPELDCLIHGVKSHSLSFRWFVNKTLKQRMAERQRRMQNLVSLASILYMYIRIYIYWIAMK